MIQFFKNARVLLGALALIVFTHAQAHAQNTVSPTPTPTLKATPTPKATPNYSPGRILSLVTPQGSFKRTFKSFSEAFDASQGNSYNQTLKKGSEIIVMNARCGDGYLDDKTTFSIYSLASDVAPLVKTYIDGYVKTLGEGPSKTRERERALINETMRLLALSNFPRKADCDIVPVALSLPQGSVLVGVVRLEIDGAKSPIVGTKFNDGFLRDALMKNDGFMASPMAMRREFWDKYGYNRFSTAQDALNVAGLMAGPKLLVFNGTNFSIYRSNFSYDYKADDTQYNVFKTTPLPKDWKIVAVVLGKKFITIYDPNAK